MTGRILAADIGGTNSRFSAFELRPGESAPRKADSCWLQTGEAESFPDLLSKLRRSGLSMKPEEADIAVIAVAGPVQGDSRSAPPFISWEIDLEASRGEAGWKRAVLINDFVAQAFATRSQAASSAEPILPGKAAPGGNVAVLGAGTGLGMAALVPNGTGGYLAVPSEGGHAAFPALSFREQSFQEYLRARTGDAYATGNTVVSGRGISLIHAFLTGEEVDPPTLSTRLAGEERTLSWAARFYGRVCRDYALKILALGGVYVAGGVAARNPELLRHPSFAEEFRLSPDMGALLSLIPLHLITDQESGLWGAASLGAQLLAGEGS